MNNVIKHTPLIVMILLISWLILEGPVWVKENVTSSKNVLIIDNNTGEVRLSYKNQSDIEKSINSIFKLPEYTPPKDVEDRMRRLLKVFMIIHNVEEHIIELRFENNDSINAYAKLDTSIYTRVLIVIYSGYIKEFENHPHKYAIYDDVLAHEFAHALGYISGNLVAGYNEELRADLYGALLLKKLNLDCMGNYYFAKHNIDTYGINVNKRYPTNTERMKYTKLICNQQVNQQETTK